MFSSCRVKKLILASALLAAPFLAQAQAVFFNDTFGNGSTLNGTSARTGTATASATSYDVASTKADTTGPTIAANKLHFGLTSGTTAGYAEMQALFATTPVHLVNVGDSITLTVNFTNFSGTLLAGGSGSFINLGLYNSGGNVPVAGSLNNSGLGTISTFVSGNCQNWQGYVSEVSSNAFTSKLFTRPFQTAANNANQDVVFSAAGTGLFTTPAGTQIGSAVTAGPTLVSGAKYAMTLSILLSAPGQVSVTNTLLDGSGNVLQVLGGTTGAANTYTNYANLYDGLCVGVGNKGTSINPQMDISQITITTNYYFPPTVSGLNNQTVIAGTSPVLSPAITGNPSPGLQWYLSTDGGATSNAIGGATGPTFTLANVQYSQNNYQYTLLATNLVGTNSQTMTLSVIVTPNIAGLNNQAAQVGSLVTIAPTVTGVPTPTLQWQTNGVNLADGLDANGSLINGSQTSELDITNAQVGDSATYTLIASNSAGSITNSMTLTIASGIYPPHLTGPTNQTVIQGNNATFTASAIGVPVPTYQWLDPTQTPILNETNGTLTLTDVQYSQNGSLYYFVATNPGGSVTNDAQLTVIVSPGITNQPTSLIVTNTQAASFSVLAGGVPALAYQWYFNSNAISLAANSSAQSATLSFAHASPTNDGTYYVVISNTAGTTNSASVTLTVNSAIGATTLTPQNGQNNVCYDTPFYVTFNGPMVMNKNGKIRIYNVNNPATPVDTIDLSLIANGVLPRANFPGDNQSFNYIPVIFSGNTVAIYPPAASGIMTSNQSYYVTIDDGAFMDTNGAYFAGYTANAWQFNTKVGGPANPTNVIVAANYSGDFATVQGAVDSVPSGNTNYTLINIKNGLYEEIVDIAGKGSVTFRGQSRTGTIVGYPNNANIAPGGTTHARMAFKIDGNNVAVENMDITNMTAQGGSQAEALMIESGANHFILNNAEIDSRQDTLLANVNSSQGYFYNSLITGNFDYIWGGGNLFFTNCEIRTITGTTTPNLVAPRTDNGATGNWPGYDNLLVSNGFSFVECRMTGLTGTTNCSMSDSNGSTNGLAAFVDCSFDTNVYVNANTTAQTTYLLWESGCSNLANTVALNNTAVPFISFTQLNNGDTRLTAAENSTTWLNGWVPALAPNIISQPVNQTVGAGQSVTFTASGTGIPDPGYQWLFNGQPIAGATSASYNIASALGTNAGNYSVIVNNGSGSVTSQVATLTYILPVAATTNYTRYAGYPLGINIAGLLTAASDSSPHAVISLAGTGVSTNGVTLGNSSGFLLYQNPNNVPDQFTYTVTDGFLGTNSGLVNVVISTNSVFGTAGPVIAATNTGPTTITYSGIAGLNYSVNRATDLEGTWTTIWTTNMPAGGTFQFTDNNPPQPYAFYILVWNWY